MPKLDNILKPKEGSAILDDLMQLGSGTGDNVTEKIRNAVKKYQDYGYRPAVLEIIKSEKFIIDDADNPIFIDMCIYDLIEPLKIVMERFDFDPSIHNNYALRLAYHHNSSDCLRLLLNDDRVISKLDKKTLSELRNSYTDC